jgi:hypothetical protein
MNFEWNIRINLSCLKSTERGKVGDRGGGHLVRHCISTGQNNGKLFASEDSEEMHNGTSWDGYTGAAEFFNYYKSSQKHIASPLQR